DAVDIYVARSNQAWVIHTGDQRPPSPAQLAHHYYAVPLRIESGTDLTLYVRVFTEGSHEVPLFIWPAKEFDAKTQREGLGFVLFFGIMLIMAFYNFFVFLFVRDRAYLYYISTILSFTVLQLNLTGFMRQYFDPWMGGHRFLNNLAVPV